MKNLIILIASFFCITAIFAQADDAAKYAGTITTADLRKHLTIIAGDSMAGRETGTEGQRSAAGYIENQFKALGLDSIPALQGYQQFYPLYKDSMISSELRVNNETLEYGKDYIGMAAFNETGSFKGKKIVFAGYGISDTGYNDYKGLDVKGKIVIIFLGEPRKNGVYILSGKKRSSQWTYPGLNKKLAAAKEKGAIGVLVINPTLGKFNSGNTESSKKTGVIFSSLPAKNKLINFAILSHAYGKIILGNQFDSLVSQAKSFEPMVADTVKVKNAQISFAYDKYREVINASNVIGIVEGSDKKDEFVFLTAHYDHLGTHSGKVYYGADDDGSGTCAVIEMAEAFALAKAAGKGPRRTIVLMAVSGEEKGLWGSEYYSDHPVFPLDKTSVDLNTDMVGRIDTERKTDDTLNYVYVIGHNKLSSDLPIINEGVNNKYTNLVFDYKFDDPEDENRIYYRSDHYNFARKGVPILFFYDGMLKSDYHQPTDTVDKIYWDIYEKRTRMIFHTAWEIANREDMLKRDIPLREGSR